MKKTSISNETTRSWLASLLLLGGVATGTAEPVFTNVTAWVAPELPPVGYSAAAWADYDNDGHLDFLLTGSGFSQLWRNTGTAFANVTASVAAGLPGLHGGSVAWGDYDNDGRPDLLLAGNGHAQIWRNTEAGLVNVTANAAPGLPGGYGMTVAWADYDNDGRLDFLLTGSSYDGNGRYVAFSQIRRNTGGLFVDVTDSVAPGLPGIGSSAAAWADYDNDGRIDFILSGMTKHEPVPEEDDQYITEVAAQLWRNTGNGFMNVTAKVIPGLPGFSSVAWGDYDNDGRPDLLLIGSVLQLWRNSPGGFTNVTLQLTPGLEISGGSATWGDYDNDGRLDFLVTGHHQPTGNLVSQIWRNTSNGFTNATASAAPGLSPVVWSSVAWGDYDSDGRLDFLLTGAKSRGCDVCDPPATVSELWRNQTAPTLPPPSVLTGLPSGENPAGVTLNARVNSRGQTGTAWFTWGDSTNYGQVTAAQPMGASNAFMKFSATLTALNGGETYYFRAMASNDLGEIFVGAEDRFVLTAPGVTTAPAGGKTPASVTLVGQALPNNLPAYGWFEWGTTAAFGHSSPVQFLGNGLTVPFNQILSGLVAGQTYYFQAAASNGLGIVHGATQSFTLPTFVPATDTLTPGLPQVDGGSVAWADFDNDGRLDLFVSGYHYDEVHNIDSLHSQLWRNTGSGFVDVTATAAPGLPGLFRSSVAWGDYDNDGRMDLFLSGTTDFDYGGTSQVWQNTGNGFVDVTAAAAPGLPQLGYASVALGDYNNDGRLDFLLTGSYFHEDEEISARRHLSQVWQNTGGGFSNVTALVAPGLPGVSFGAAAWADYDNDGRLDFLITGSTNGSSSGGIAQLWQNTGSGFSNVTASAAAGLPGLFASSVAWNDYDQDGHLDFLVTGWTNDSSGFRGTTAQLWRNAGGTFTNVTPTAAPGLAGIGYGTAAWGDFDNDGRVDFLVSGLFYDGAESFVTELWRNTGTGFANVTGNLAPGVPSLANSSAAWGDYDNDGRLDFLLSGRADDQFFTQIWRNHTSIPNTLPAAPTGLAMTATKNAVMLSWNSATDDQTPAGGLSYQVRAGSVPGGNDLISANGDPASGVRRVPALGNAMLRHTLPLTGLTNGQMVYWSVQAVDTALAGGAFSVETSVVSIPRLSVTSGGPAQAVVSWMPPTFGWVLQHATRLIAPDWTEVPGTSSNPTLRPATNDARFYRLATP